MKHLLRKDRSCRPFFYRNEFGKMVLKYILCDKKLSENMKYFVFFRYNSFSRSSSIVHFNNRCFITGKSGSVHKFCGISRIAFRRLFSKGMFTGVKKAS